MTAHTPRVTELASSITFGLARVSTDEQILDRQLDALREAGVLDKHISIEHGVSGRAKSRPELDALVERTRAGDTIVALSLDRVGRSLRDLLTLIAQLDDRGVTLRVLTPALTIDGSPSGRLLVAVLGAAAEFEAAVLSERVRQGIAAARLRGKRPGRPEALNAIQRMEVVRLAGEGRPTTELAQLFGASPRTIRRAVAVSTVTMERLTP